MSTVILFDVFESCLLTDEGEEQFVCLHGGPVRDAY
jgi:hypothetical protein